MKERFKEFLKIIHDALEDYKLNQKEPINLYMPLHYSLETKGKYLRPILAIAAFELFSTDFEKIKKPALALEWFHNFTLIHDDIIDEAPLRRGKPTVYKKWNRNTAILSGDVLLIKSYQLFEDLPPGLYKKILSLFTQTAIKVCEGQQFDMDFESQTTVALSEYMEMIRLKTAVLLGLSLKMGALIGGASDRESEQLYLFGENLGIAFQIQDDYLDVYGNIERVGKQQAGDIYKNKKTFLYLKAIEKATPDQKKRLQDLYATHSQKRAKADEVMHLFEALNIPQETMKICRLYENKALNHLENITTKGNKDNLKFLAKYLTDRSL